jgi:glycosyltransferase involved in cell wall biosynthesis
MSVADRKRILVVVDWYLPGTKAGGPVRSIAAIVAKLSTWYDFSVFTSDRDLGDPTAYADIALHQWTLAPDGTRTWYSSLHAPVSTAIGAALRSEQPDIIYINGIFSAFCRAALSKARRKRIPVVIAPRGMLGQGALKIKAGKKKLFLNYARLTGMFNGVKWHASSEAEKAEVLAVFPGANVEVAMNLALPVTAAQRTVKKQPGEASLVFLSRISRKKNLTGLLEMLRQVRPELLVTLDIYGPIEDEAYWKQCLALAGTLPQHITVVYQGPIPHEKTGAAFSASDLFVFPTFHENFGHTIIESLQCGTPVLISDQTPWRNLAAHNAGWELPLADSAAFTAIIEKVAAMDEAELDEWRRGARKFAAQYSDDEKLIGLNRRLFE